MPPPGPITGGGPTKAYVDAGDAATLLAAQAYTDGAIAGLPRRVRCIFTRQLDSASLNTDGTEDVIRSFSAPDAGDYLFQDGDKYFQYETVQIVGSATATRRIFKYFDVGSAGGVQVFDSGVLTISGGSELHLFTEVFRVDNNNVRVTVVATTTSASIIPYTTLTDVNGGDMDTGASVLTTTAIAAGIGAASGDIISKSVTVLLIPKEA